MKKIFALFVVIILSLNSLNSQVAPPQQMSFKATITKTLPGGTLAIVPQKTIGLMINILKGGPDGDVVYTEIFNPKTNSSGQIDLILGLNGTPSFSSIPWSQDIFCLQVWVDLNGGTAYGSTPLSTIQLLSVPYSLYAGGVDFSNVINKPTTASGYGITDVVTTYGDQDISGNKTFNGNIIPNGSIISNGNITIESKDNNVIVVAGTSKVTISPSGGVTIEGSNIAITATGDLKLSGENVDIKGTNVNVQAAKLGLFGTLSSTMFAPSISLTAPILFGITGGTTNLTSIGPTKITGTLVEIN